MRLAYSNVADGIRSAFAGSIPCSQHSNCFMRVFYVLRELKAGGWIVTRQQNHRDEKPVVTWASIPEGSMWIARTVAQKHLDQNPIEGG